MKKCVLLLLAMSTALLVGTGFKFNETVPAAPDTSGTDTSQAHPCCNCFWGYVYIRDIPHGYHPVGGDTVYLYFYELSVPGGWTPLDTCQTNNHGMYWFCNFHPGGWTTGTYLIKTGGWCGQEKAVDREHNGDIQVDFYIPNPCPHHAEQSPPIPEL